MSSYWEKTGKYQKEYDILSKRIPDKGESFDTRIELLRCASNIYYDIFNNGGCNLADEDRGDEYRYVSSRVDISKIENYLQVYQDEQENWDDIDHDNLDSDKMFKQVCKDMDEVIDQVIEKILATGILEEKIVG